jgi:hypothetical protein
MTCVDEGHVAGGKFVVTRRLNGDENTRVATCACRWARSACSA